VMQFKRFVSNLLIATISAATLSAGDIKDDDRDQRDTTDWGAVWATYPRDHDSLAQPLLDCFNRLSPFVYLNAPIRPDSPPPTANSYTYTSPAIKSIQHFNVIFPNPDQVDRNTILEAELLSRDGAVIDSIRGGAPFSCSMLDTSYHFLRFLFPRPPEPGVYSMRIFVFSGDHEVIVLQFDGISIKDEGITITGNGLGSEAGMTESTAISAAGCSAHAGQPPSQALRLGIISLIIAAGLAWLRRRTS